MSRLVRESDSTYAAKIVALVIGSIVFVTVLRSTGARDDAC
jgi:hypothetical protein